jgi:hypothetical protein
MTVRRFLALVAAIGLFGLASIALIDWMTRPTLGSSPPAARASAPVSPPPPASSMPPEPALDAPAAPKASPQEPVAARAAPPEPVRKPAPPPQDRRASDPRAARVDVSFKLDPRLTGGLHMGTRWVSPRTYTRSGDLKNVVVEARARVVNGDPQRPHARTAWMASEPDMVEVSPEEGAEVRITVWRPGESKLIVAAGSVSETLTVKAAEVGGALRVDIAR